MVETHHKHGLKVVSFGIDMGERHWFIVGCYLFPDNAYPIERVVMSMG